LGQRLFACPIRVVKKQDRIELLVAILGNSVGHGPPHQGERHLPAWVELQLAGQKPHHLQSVGPHQIDPRHRQAALAEIPGEHLEKQRLAASLRADEQAQATPIVDEEVESGQGLFVRRALVEEPRVESGPEGRLVETPVRVVH